MVRPTDTSALDENVEKKSATAVSKAISSVIISTARASRGSTAGVVHESRMFSGEVQAIHARTAHNATAITHRLTAMVSTSPTYLPTMNSQRGRGLASKPKMLLR